MKRCSKCREWKDESEFYNDKRARDGLYPKCKTCHIEATRKYRDSERGQAVISAYLKSEKGQNERIESQKRYNQSEKAKYTQRIKRLYPEFETKNKRYQKRYNQSEKGKATRARYKERNQKKIQARKAILIEIRAKRMPPAKELTCYHCKNQARHYHHYKGYTPEYWLDVIPLCIKCHTIEHNNQKSPE